MASAILFPGFLNQALAYGFRIGTTQIAGGAEWEEILAKGPMLLSCEKLGDDADIRKLCRVLPSLSVGVFSPKDVRADDLIVEGFSFLIGALCTGMAEDLEAAMGILETGSIGVANLDPSDYDFACRTFEEAVAQARNEARHAPFSESMIHFLNQLAGFTKSVNSGDPMNLLTWSLRTLAHLPPEWELPGVVLQLLTAQMEWKLLLFAPSAVTLTNAALQMRRVQTAQHDWDFEGRLNYLAGTALLVTSFSGSNDAFGEAIEAYKRALLCFERAEKTGPELHEKFSKCFAVIGDILESRGRHEEARVAYTLADNARHPFPPQPPRNDGE